MDLSEDLGAFLKSDGRCNEYANEIIEEYVV